MLQEFEDKVPFYVEQTLDRLEAKRIIRDWNRNECESEFVFSLPTGNNPANKKSPNWE